MKKFVLLVAVALTLGLVACGNSKSNETEAVEDTATTNVVTAPEEATEDSTTVVEATATETTETEATN